jgi:hypothetical protein
MIDILLSKIRSLEQQLEILHQELDVCDPCYFAKHTKLVAEINDKTDELDALRINIHSIKQMQYAPA